MPLELPAPLQDWISLSSGQPNDRFLEVLKVFRQAPHR